MPFPVCSTTTAPRKKRLHKKAIGVVGNVSGVSPLPQFGAVRARFGQKKSGQAGTGSVVSCRQINTAIWKQTTAFLHGIQIGWCRCQAIAKRNQLRMKKLLSCLLLLLTMACNQGGESTAERVPEKAEKPLAPTLPSGILAPFSDRFFDTLWVYATPDGKGEFEGVPLDSAVAVLFPPEIAEKHFSNPPGLFALYRFPLVPGITGLLARTPDWYAPNSIKFFYFDRQQDTITSYIELAQRWGDGGDFHRKDAWIFRTADSGLQALVWLYQEHDNSIENPKDTTKTVRQSYALLGLSGTKADTLSKDSAVLAERFSHLTGKVAERPN